MAALGKRLKKESPQNGKHKGERRTLPQYELYGCEDNIKRG